MFTPEDDDVPPTDDAPSTGFRFTMSGAGTVSDVPPTPPATPVDPPSTATPE